jgi:hypothetical protein
MAFKVIAGSAVSSKEYSKVKEGNAITTNTKEGRIVHTISNVEACTTFDGTGFLV